MINLLYAGNEKVFDGLLISLLSITKHTTDPLNVICLTMDLTDKDARFIPISNEQVNYLQDMLKEVNKDSKITLIDMRTLFLSDLGKSKNLGTHFTPYTMLRLLADKVSEVPDKIIYLDTDTVVNSDINQLWNVDVENYEFACVKDLYNWASPSRWKIKNYFNAGVLLFNMKRCRETGLFEKARDLVNNKKLMYVDQDALNHTVTQKLMLPVKFNSKDKYYPEIVVHHFCNVREGKVKFIGKWWHRIKPWHVDLVKQKMSAYNDLLDEYLERKNKFLNKSA